MAFGVGEGGGWGGGEEGRNKVEVLRNMADEFIRELLTGESCACFSCVWSCGQYLQTLFRFSSGLYP